MDTLFKCHLILRGHPLLGGAICPNVISRVGIPGIVVPEGDHAGARERNVDDAGSKASTLQTPWFRVY